MCEYKLSSTTRQRTLLVGSLGVLCAGFFAGSSPAAPPLTLRPFVPSGIYEQGETVGWIVKEADAGSSAPTAYTYKIKKNNYEQIAAGSLDLSSGSTKVG